MAPTKRVMVASLGEMPTPSVRRLISALTRSSGWIRWLWLSPQTQRLPSSTVTAFSYLSAASVGLGYTTSGDAVKATAWKNWPKPEKGIRGAAAPTGKGTGEAKEDAAARLPAQTAHAGWCRDIESPTKGKPSSVGAAMPRMPFAFQLPNFGTKPTGQVPVMAPDSAAKLPLGKIGQNRKKAVAAQPLPQGKAQERLKKTPQAGYLPKPHRQACAGTWNHLVVSPCGRGG